MRDNVACVLSAMRADDIPAAQRGLWEVGKYAFTRPALTRGYTFLFRVTEATMHEQFGEVVMEDTPHELRRHLNFALRASGRVLVTGLGLGCVVRGLLCRSDVTQITVIERDRDVVAMVQPHMPRDPRLMIIHADVFDWADTTDDRFDYAWHDIWSDPDAGEAHLSLLHMDLFLRLRRRVKRQGGWGFERWYLSSLKRRFPFWYENRLDLQETTYGQI